MALNLPQSHNYLRLPNFSSPPTPIEGQVRGDAFFISKGTGRAPGGSGKGMVLTLRYHVHTRWYWGKSSEIRFYD